MLDQKFQDRVHFSSTLHHIVMGLSRACLDVFLHDLNQ